jgi:hypothetical protein
MQGSIQRLPGPSASHGILGIGERICNPRVIAVTADLRLYSSVLNAATSARWPADWARTLNRAIEICSAKSPAIVVYDSYLPGVDWGWAFDRLNTVASESRILLAAPSIDEELWKSVLEHQGYDAVERGAGSEQLGRIFRFAWLSLVPPTEV